MAVDSDEWSELPRELQKSPLAPPHFALFFGFFLDSFLNSCGCSTAKSKIPPQELETTTGWVEFGRDKEFINKKFRNKWIGRVGQFAYFGLHVHQIWLILILL